MILLYFWMTLVIVVDSRLKVHKVECVPNLTYWNATIKLINIKEGLLLNGDAMFLEQMNKGSVRIKARRLSDELQSNKVTEQVINLCKVINGREIIINVIMAAVKNNINIPLRCPYKKNIPIAINNLSIPTSFIPSFLLNLRFELQINLQGLFKGQKKFQEFYAVNVVGEIK